MVNISLTNKNPHSDDSSVTINLVTSTCILSDKREIPLKEFVNKSDFWHPLLSEKFTQTPDNNYLYEYDSIDDLLYVGIYVYSTLLKADNPAACSFKIKPSPIFCHYKVPHKLAFSIDSSKFAEESVSIKQLESMVSQIKDITFVFSEEFIIDEILNLETLPSSINGDTLYTIEHEILALLKKPNDLSCYELRYINPMIGFGVFCKQTINQGDIIGIYSGKKLIQKRHIKSDYRYNPEDDCLMLATDAKEYGNITRFINHAPDPDINDNALSQDNLLNANVISTYHYLNGLEVPVYKAKRQILKGEQLLVSYGVRFFQKSTEIRFKQNGQPLETRSYFKPNGSDKKIHHLGIMANNGVKKARVYLQMSMLIKAIVVCMVIAGFINLPDLMG